MTKMTSLLSDSRLCHFLSHLNVTIKIYTVVYSTFGIVGRENDKDDKFIE